MATWKPARQADAAIKDIDRVGKPRLGPEPGETRDYHVYGIRTREVYRECIERQAEYAIRHFKCTRDRLTPAQAIQYLEWRAETVRDKRLSHERCALTTLRHLRPYEMDFREVKPVNNQPGRLATEKRVNTRAQIEAIMSHENERNARSTDIAFTGGLRAHELLTLQAPGEREPTPREAWDQARFEGYKDPVFYTTQGKGGLVRHVPYEREYAERVIEPTRYPDHKIHHIRDRGVPQAGHYDLAGGNAWSASVSRASLAALGFSLGAHAARHTFIEHARDGFLEAGHSDDDSLKLSSQLIGHFRPGITRTYLR